MIEHLAAELAVVIRQPKDAVEFMAYYKLRWKVLREPWVSIPNPRPDEDEATSTHLLACTEDNQVVGVGRLHLNTPQQAQIRYMATVEEMRNRGIGKKLVVALERVARDIGANQIMLNAREQAINFYSAQGYRIVADGPILFGVIKHKQMYKDIT